MTERQRFPRIDQVTDIEVPLSVVLAEKTFPLEQILELRPGVVLSFSRRPESPLVLHVNGSRVGTGRAVDAEDRLAFRLDEIEVFEAK
ncbi:MAG TPA: FliM/FliN family flagellar motor C-terminal domain-containing protein [Planctomycetota bacterium]|nr:FliM/FliN family flagellar motor C-terminal domain-containing protein [Planctomycetota bacterium]